MVLAESLNGLLRLRAFKNGKTAVVELKTSEGHWVYCVRRSAPLEKAWATFQAQCKFHVN